MRSFLFCLITCLVIVGSQSSRATAQVLYGSLVGTITDQTRAVVPNAAVRVTNTQTGLVRESAADNAGNYSIPNLLEGDYDLLVSARGFKPLTQKRVSIQINNVTHVDASLEIGVATESVTVSGSGALLQTTKADVNTTLGSQAIENLPLPGYRNFQSLVNFVPGATPGRFQNAVIDTPQRDLSTNVNGQERGANNTRVDGAANILVTMPHHMVYV
ncbi:MAG: carboxypeptidase-like regulatory domain-containing protein, partial [Bryobacteraceae bacterium]